MSTDQRDVTDPNHRVIPFRPRPKRARPWPAQTNPAVTDDSPVADLSRFERDESDEDYRKRMLVNAIAFSFTIFLVVAGTWLTWTLTDLRRKQDCALSGLRTCDHITVPARDRY